MKPAADEGENDSNSSIIKYNLYWVLWCNASANVLQVLTHLTWFIISAIRFYANNDGMLHDAISRSIVYTAPNEHFQ